MPGWLNRKETSNERDRLAGKRRGRSVSGVEGQAESTFRGGVSSRCGLPSSCLVASASVSATASPRSATLTHQPLNPQHIYTTNTPSQTTRPINPHPRSSTLLKRRTCLLASASASATACPRCACATPTP
jgi:hypothetical protein